MKHPNRSVRIAQFYSQCLNAIWLVGYGHTVHYLRTCKICISGDKPTHLIVHELNPRELRAKNSSFSGLTSSIVRGKGYLSKFWVLED